MKFMIGSKNIFHGKNGFEKRNVLKIQSRFKIKNFCRTIKCIARAHPKSTSESLSSRIEISKLDTTKLLLEDVQLHTIVGFLLKKTSKNTLLTHILRRSAQNDFGLFFLKKFEVKKWKIGSGSNHVHKTGETGFFWSFWFWLKMHSTHDADFLF